MHFAPVQLLSSPSDSLSMLNMLLQVMPACDMDQNGCPMQHLRLSMPKAYATHGQWLASLMLLEHTTTLHIAGALLAIAGLNYTAKLYC